MFFVLKTQVMVKHQQQAAASLCLAALTSAGVCAFSHASGSFAAKLKLLSSRRALRALGDLFATSVKVA